MSAPFTYKASVVYGDRQCLLKMRTNLRNVDCERIFFFKSRMHDKLLRLKYMSPFTVLLTSACVVMDSDLCLGTH